MKRYIIYLFILYWVTGCIEDNGNYRYDSLNAIEIENFAVDTFRLDQYDTLKIKPVLHFSSTTLTDLSYEWSIDHKLISTDPVCYAKVSNKPNLEKRAYTAGLCITDNKTNLKYYKDFHVAVSNSFSNALYILSEREDETGILSFQRRDKPSSPLVYNIFEDINPDFGTLGKKPRQVFYQTFPKIIFGVLCQEGDKKMSILDPTSLELTRYYTEEAIQGDYNGTFNPEKITLYMGGMIASGGKMFGYNYMSNSAIYRPVNGDYEFAPWVDTHESFDSYVWVSYDNKNQQFVKLKPGKDILAYDNITPLTIKNVSTAGQRFLAAGSEDISSMDVKKHVILYDKSANKACFYSIGIGFSFITFEGDVTSFTKGIEKENLVNENSVCLYTKALYWYIAKDNIVNRLHRDGGDPAVWFTAPKGNIVAMLTDVVPRNKTSVDRRLFVATCDGTKSYIYVVDIQTRELLEEPMEMDGKIVSMVVKGNWKY